VAARDEAAPVRDGDGCSPAVAFDHGGDGGDLGGGVRVGIFRMRFQVRNQDKLIVCAMDFHSAEWERKGAPLQNSAGRRTLPKSRIATSNETQLQFRPHRASLVRW